VQATKRRSRRSLCGAATPYSSRAFLVHRTGSLGGVIARIAFSYRYNNAAEPSFVARNYPSPYVYRPDMRLLQDDFPTAADVRRFFP